MKITVDHIISAKQCCAGGRRWFKSHGLDWSDFVTKGGIDEEVILAIDDEMARDVVKHAYEVEHGR